MSEWERVVIHVSPVLVSGHLCAIFFFSFFELFVCFFILCFFLKFFPIFFFNFFIFCKISKFSKFSAVSKHKAQQNQNKLVVRPGQFTAKFKIASFTSLTPFSFVVSSYKSATGRSMSTFHPFLFQLIRQGRRHRPVACGPIQPCSWRCGAVCRPAVSRSVTQGPHDVSGARMSVWHQVSFRLRRRNAASAASEAMEKPRQPPRVSVEITDMSSLAGNSFLSVLRSRTPAACSSCSFCFAQMLASRAQRPPPTSRAFPALQLTAG